jgi:hypothetical protein
MLDLGDLLLFLIGFVDKSFRSLLTQFIIKSRLRFLWLVEHSRYLPRPFRKQDEKRSAFQESLQI